MSAAAARRTHVLDAPGPDGGVEPGQTRLGASPLPAAKASQLRRLSTGAAAIR
jgi:hypothetical protein